MAVKIRLAQNGRKNRRMYSIVVADARAPRDGRFIRKVGNYNPQHSPAVVRVDEGLILNWLLKGAQPTSTVRSIFSRQGIMLKKHLQVGVQKGAITEQTKEEIFSNWQRAKEAKKSSLESASVSVSQGKDSGKPASSATRAKAQGSADGDKVA